MKRIKIGDRLVGEGEPTFIVAEAGVNHNGDINLAKKLIDVAKNAGADAVKFQTFKTEKLVSQKNKYFYEMLKQLELSEDDFRELFKYAKKREIIFLSTPTDEESVDLLCELKVPAFKIASGDLTAFPFLSYVAEKYLPIILSTGMATLGEIEGAVNTIYSTGNENVILLHCVSSYPARIDEINLLAITTLKQAFNVPVGFSDHTTTVSISLAATTLGAKIIEKHFTLDKNLSGPDHKASADPGELKQIVEGIREIEKALGSPLKKPTQSELEMRKLLRRSIVARTNIPKGNIITEDMISIKRPGTGIPPKYITSVVGKIAKKDISEGDVIIWEMIG